MKGNCCKCLYACFHLNWSHTCPRNPDTECGFYPIPRLAVLRGGENSQGSCPVLPLDQCRLNSSIRMWRGQREGTKPCPGICQCFSKDFGCLVIQMLLSFLLPLLSISGHSSNTSFALTYFHDNKLLLFSYFPSSFTYTWYGRSSEFNIFHTKSRLVWTGKMCPINYDQTPEKKTQIHTWRGWSPPLRQRYKLHLIAPKGSKANITHLKMQLIICQVLLYDYVIAWFLL